MAIGGFLGGLANLGAVAGGTQQYQLQDAHIRQALAQLAAEQRRQQFFDLQMKAAQQEQQAATAGGQALGNLFGPPQQGGGGAPDYSPGAAQAQPLPPLGNGGQSVDITQVPSYGANPMGSAGLGVPPYLKQRILQGEGSLPGAIGKAGEMGRMQVTPGTERAMGFPSGTSLYSDAPGDKYLSGLYRKSGGDIAATEVGYNRGEGAMRRFQQSGDNLDSVPNLAPTYKAMVRQDIARGTIQQVQSGVPQSSARDSAQTSLDAATNIDPTQWGRSTLRDVVAAVDKSNPGLDPAVKMLAVGNLMKLMAPEDKMAFQMFMQQNRQTMQLAIKEMQLDQQRTLAEERLTQQGALANQRIADADARALLAQGGIVGTFQQGGQTYGLTRGGQTKVLDLPEGATKSTGTPRSASAMALRQFLEEFPKTHDGKQATSDDIRNFQAGMSEATSEARTTGTRAAGLEIGANVAEALIPLLKEKSDQIDRSRFPDLNSLILASETKTGGTDVVQYGEMVNSLRYAFARVMAGGTGGQPRVADLAHFDEIFNKAWSKGQVNAALEQIQKTIDRERQAVGKAKAAVRGEKPATSQPSAGGGGTAPEVTEEQYNTLPSGSPYRMPGNPTVFYKQ